jgi:Transposase and inactivated derivatives
MWSTYAGIAQTYFKDSNYVIDKYHYIRQVFWAFEAIRKEEQKRFSKTRRIYFKRSRTLLNKRYQFLTPEQKQQVDLMLYASNRLLTAYSLKEQFFKVLESSDRCPHGQRYPIGLWPHKTVAFKICCLCKYHDSLVKRYSKFV